MELRKRSSLAVSVFDKPVPLHRIGRSGWVPVRFVFVSENAAVHGEVLQRLKVNNVHGESGHNGPFYHHETAPLPESIQCASLVLAEAAARYSAHMALCTNQVMTFGRANGEEVPVCCQIIAASDEICARAAFLLHNTVPNLDAAPPASPSELQDPRFREFLTLLTERPAGHGEAAE